MAKKSAPRRPAQMIDPDTGEVIEGGENLPAVVPDEFLPAEGAPAIVHRVTVPVLRFDPGQTVVCKIITPIEEGEELKQVNEKSKKAKYGPAYLARVEGVHGGVRQLVFSTVLRGELDKEYPGATYVGKWFQISKFAPQPGKDYNTFEIIEVKAPARKAAA